MDATLLDTSSDEDSGNDADKENEKGYIGHLACDLTALACNLVGVETKLRMVSGRTEEANELLNDMTTNPTSKERMIVRNLITAEQDSKVVRFRECVDTMRTLIQDLEEVPDPDTLLAQYRRSTVVKKQKDNEEERLGPMHYVVLTTIIAAGVFLGNLTGIALANLWW